jgi:hypothetical protein
VVDVVEVLDVVDVVVEVVVVGHGTVVVVVVGAVVVVDVDVVVGAVVVVDVDVVVGAVVVVDVDVVGAVVVVDVDVVVGAVVVVDVDVGGAVVVVDVDVVDVLVGGHGVVVVVGPTVVVTADVVVPPGGWCRGELDEPSAVAPVATSPAATKAPRLAKRGRREIVRIVVAPILKRPSPHRNAMPVLWTPQVPQGVLFTQATRVGGTHIPRSAVAAQRGGLGSVVEKETQMSGRHGTARAVHLPARLVPSAIEVASGLGRSRHVHETCHRVPARGAHGRQLVRVRS